jgi:hypothetical protein
VKRIVILGIIILVVAGTTQWFIMRASMGDQGVWVPYAFGNAEESIIEMHVLVDIGMMRREEAADKSAKKYEDGWTMLHWDLQNASGEAVPFSVLAWSPLIDNDKCKAVPEFFIKYTLKKGEKYTLTYTPRVKKQPKVKYRFALTAPSEPHAMQRVLFDLVKN